MTGASPASSRRGRSGRSRASLSRTSRRTVARLALRQGTLVGTTSGLRHRADAGHGGVHRGAHHEVVPCNDADMESTRLDRWLWATRIFGSRTAATEACRGGHVRLNGARAKPAATVRVGDRITARSRQHERILEVVRVIDKRVGAPIAAECFIDETPTTPTGVDPAPFIRDAASGRPTKRDRRRLDRVRRR